MKTILRNARTGLYFQGISDWTERVETAFDFQRPERLVRFIRGADLDPGEMELVLAFDNPRHNLSLAIDERFGVKRRKPRRGMRMPAIPPRVVGAARVRSGSKREPCRSLAGAIL